MENTIAHSLSHNSISVSYRSDILEGFESAQLKMEDDYEGSVVATLIRKLSSFPTGKAVLYIHGFNDYFFQAEMAARYNDNGFTFYAVDLRKYGRSYLKHQKFNNVRDLREYFDDIDLDLTIIKQEGHDDVLLSGHSTGGLIVTLYAHERKRKDLFSALFLNSPFFEFNLPYLKKLVMPLAVKLGSILPNMLMRGGFSKLYGQSLHKNDYGEWTYDLTLKPPEAPNVNLGWIRAIYNGHQKVKQGVFIDKPVLIMMSQLSVFENKWSKKMYAGDAILNVADIENVAKGINGEVTLIKINRGMHDLVLSQKEVREEVYNSLFMWLKEKFTDKKKAG